MLPRVFELFRQGESSGAGRSKGLGLGLSIVRHIIEAHGGTVTAESPGEGLGSTFTVRLPLIHAETSEALPDIGKDGCGLLPSEEPGSALPAAGNSARIS